jgi:hypothetical protein
MNLRSHIKISFIVTAVWGLFWLLGWPDYYQQYSTRLMVIFVVILAPLFWILVIRMLRSINSGRIYKSIILSTYFTVPFFVYGLRLLRILFGERHGISAQVLVFDHLLNNPLDHDSAYGCPDGEQMCG